MSDIDDKPWDHVTDRRAHRCHPMTRDGTEPVAGMRYRCTCGRTYVFTERQFRQWLPVSDVSVPGSHARHRGGPPALALFEIEQLGEVYMPVAATGRSSERVPPRLSATQ